MIGAHVHEIKCSIFIQFHIEVACESLLRCRTSCDRSDTLRSTRIQTKFFKTISERVFIPYVLQRDVIY